MTRFLFVTVFLFLACIACTTTEEGELLDNEVAGDSDEAATSDEPGSESTPMDEDVLVADDEQNDELIPDQDNAACEWDDPNGDDDEDGIPNQVEGCGDADLDGAPNHLDTDSDGDGLLDKDECPSQPCKNSDQDEKPDFLDKDSDNDGLADKEESTLGTDPYDKDTDDDGSDDLAEIVYEKEHPGSADPKDPNKKIPDGLFYVVLPYQAPEDVTRTLLFSTDFSRVDIGIMLDLSGSMEQELNNLRDEIQTKIIEGIPLELPGVDIAFGFLHFQHYQQNLMFQVDQTITTDGAKVVTAVNQYTADDVWGGVEPMVEVLYQASTGEGLTANYFQEASFGGGYTTNAINLPPTDCTGEAGNIGGMCFRTFALPIFIMITDEKFPVIGIQGTASCPAQSSYFQDPEGCWDPNFMGHSFEEAISAMNSVNAKFIGIDSGFKCDGTEDENGNCDSTYSPTDDAKNDFLMVADMTASLDLDGTAFLYHTADSTGNGLSDQIADAVKQLTTFIEKDINTVAESDESCNDISAAAFIVSSKPNKADPDNGYASKDDTTFYKVQPGTEVYFDVHFHNDFCRNTALDPKVYKARIRVLGEGAFLSSREVQVIIPGSQAE
ncbi:MAG TPA: hypothetical protein P5077_01015 [bacterium]|nr:hypothetical protein [bacterium]